MAILIQKLLYFYVIWFYINILSKRYASCQQLLQNPGFEQPLEGDDWICHGPCDLVQDTDAHTGLYSGRVTNRGAEWHVVSQYVGLNVNTTYYFECWVKVLDVLPGNMYHDVILRLEIIQNGESSGHMHIAVQPYMRPGLGWQKLSGDFSIDEEFTEVRLYIQHTTDSIEYLVDTTSLTKLVPDDNWKAEANARIESIRKRDVAINTHISEDYNPNLVTIEIAQTGHHFAFGSAVREDQMIGTDEDSHKYRQCFFENFHWSVFHNAHKWKQMEKVQGVIEYPDEAVKVLQENGSPMRGHNLFWGKEQNVPSWVPTLSAEELIDSMRDRLNYTVPRYKDVVLHWDVNNEQVHGDLFESKTGNPDFMTDLFYEVQAYDENAVLFLNDFSVVSKGQYTRALVNSAERLLSQGAPLRAIGAQGHMDGAVPTDQIMRMQKRLEVIGSVGLPIWITELDIGDLSNENVKADAYDDVITMYFSDPNIEGIILWGFAELHHSKPEAALFDGADYIPNAAGLRWQEMLFERWHTSDTFNPSTAEETFYLRGFQGGYSVKVKYEDATIQNDTFYLGSDDMAIDIII